MSRPLRALLLAAGYGTRLKPITNHIPKCLVDVGGEPLLSRWLRQLEASGCESVLVNTHYLSEQVNEYLQNNLRTSMHVETIYEKELLGTGGTVMANLSFFKNSTGLILHADNVMVGDLHGLLQAHALRPPECLMTMLTFTTGSPHSCGIVITDENGIVSSFHEKVANPPGNIANGAIYAIDSDFLHYLAINNLSPIDLSTDLIPRLSGRINTWHTSKPYIDIGNPESLLMAQNVLHSLGAK